MRARCGWGTDFNRELRKTGKALWYKRHGEEGRLIWCRKVLWSCTTASGTEADEPLQTRKERHERVRKMLKIILKLEEGKTREMMDRRGRRKKSHQERMRSFFMAQEDLWDTAQKKCKHCTILAHIPHFRSRGFFSRGTSLCLCLDNTTFTSGHHVSRAGRCCSFI